MNRIIKTMVISLLLVLSMPMAKLSAQVSTWDGTWEPWTHGTGTEADPFLIENAQQLAYLAYRVNNGLDAGGGHVSNHDYHYKLMIDINLNGSENFQWTPIGYWNSSSDHQRFGGCFDGNGHTVSGLYIKSSAHSVGLFGYVEEAIVANLGVIGGTITTTSTYAGGIIGVAHGTCVITNCYNTGSVSSYNTWPEDSSSHYSGGIIGDAYMANITNCYNIGNVSSSSYSHHSYSGGIVGWASGGANITNCYNTGTISSSTYSSYYSYYSGGIVGYKPNPVSEAVVINSYYLNTCGGNNTYGGQSMSADAMKTQEFVEALNSGICAYEYDFDNTNSGYPVLTMILVMATTQNAMNVTESHTTLLGTLNVENTNVHVQGFEYKKSTESNYQTVNVSGNGNISKTLSGLTPNTEYTYRVFCTPDDCGTYYGEEKTFTTLPVNVITYPTTDATTSSATLHGSMYFGDATLTSHGFEYRAVGETDFVSVNVAGNDNDFDFQLTGLQLNTTYEYRAFMNIAESLATYYGTTKTFEVTWLNQDTICVNNAEMLRWVSEQCNSGTTFQGKCIKLMNDITLPLNVPNNMTSIGSYPNYPFKGTFDGNGKLVYNLYIDQPNTPYQGFFGYTLNANLYNVGLVNITASGRNYTGGMVAYAENTYMRDCYVNGGTLFALSYCGGLVGYQEQGTNSIISGCYNTCEVTGNNYVGGLIGFSNYSTVRNSYVAGRVAAQGEPVGAIIGGANEVLMYYCYFSIELTGQTNAIGWNNFKDGGEGLTNAQMRDPQFVNTLNQNLVTPVWMADYTTHINNGFPIIKWQRPGTGVEEHDAAKSYVSLYPNPANSFVTIQSDEPNVSLKHVEVYDVTGRKVMSETLDGQKQGFSIDNLVSGVYHVRVQTSNGCCTNLKLVVE